MMTHPQWWICGWWNLKFETGFQGRYCTVQDIDWGGGGVNEFTFNWVREVVGCVSCFYDSRPGVDLGGGVDSEV